MIPPPQPFASIPPGKNDRTKPFLIVFGILFFLVALGWRLYVWLETRAYNEALRVDDLPTVVEEYRKTGLPWVASDVDTGSHVPFSENATPLLNKALELFPGRQFAQERNTLIFEADHHFSKGLLISLTSAAPSLKAVEEAMKKPKLVLVADWDVDKIEPMGDLRNLCFALNMRAEGEADEGNIAAAVQDLDVVEELVRRLLKAPGGLSFIVASSIEVVWNNSVQRCAATWAKNPAALQRLISNLPKPRLELSFRDLIRQIVYESVEASRNFTALKTGSDPMDRRASGPAPVLRRTGVPDAPIDRAAFAATLRYWVQAFPKLQSDGDHPLKLGRELEATIDASRSLGMTLASANMQAFDSLAEVYCAQDAGRRVTSAFVHSLLAHAQTGRWPKAAAEIPGGPWIDPFTDKPLRVLVAGNTFRVYSFGRKGHDHGGKNRLEVSPTQAKAQEFDIVGCLPSDATLSVGRRYASQVLVRDFLDGPKEAIHLLGGAKHSRKNRLPD